VISADDILRDLEAFTFKQVGASHPELVAIACARALFECLFLNFRKQYLYVPTGTNHVLQQRHEMIWREFNGRNYGELAIKHKLSLQQIYNVINVMRADAVRRRQADLFAADIAEIERRPLLMVVMQDYLPADLQRAGLAAAESHVIASEIAGYLCATYPGISIRITEAMRQRRRGDNGDLFDEAV